MAESNYIDMKTFTFDVFYCPSLIQSQISPASKAAYREYLTKLEQMYNKLLVRKKQTFQLYVP